MPDHIGSRGEQRTIKEEIRQVSVRCKNLVRVLKGPTTRSSPSIVRSILTESRQPITTIIVSRIRNLVPAEPLFTITGTNRPRTVCIAPDISQIGSERVSLTESFTVVASTTSEPLGGSSVRFIASRSSSFTRRCGSNSKQKFENLRWKFSIKLWFKGFH